MALQARCGDVGERKTDEEIFTSYLCRSFYRLSKAFFKHVSRTEGCFCLLHRYLGGTSFLIPIFGCILVIPQVGLGSMLLANSKIKLVLSESTSYCKRENRIRQQHQDHCKNLSQGVLASIASLASKERRKVDGQFICAFVRARKPEKQEE